eukprot:11559034-Alexandrium_andersonii.AAC.1
MPRFGGGGGDGGGGGANFNARLPPAWNPEHEQSYSFRAWVQDLQLWLMVGSGPPIVADGHRPSATPAGSRR